MAGAQRPERPGAGPDQRGGPPIDRDALTARRVLHRGIAASRPGPQRPAPRRRRGGLCRPGRGRFSGRGSGSRAPNRPEHGCAAGSSGCNVPGRRGDAVQRFRDHARPRDPGPPRGGALGSPARPAPGGRGRGDGKKAEVLERAEHALALASGVVDSVRSLSRAADGDEAWDRQPLTEVVGDVMRERQLDTGVEVQVANDLPGSAGGSCWRAPPVKAAPSAWRSPPASCGAEPPRTRAYPIPRSIRPWPIHIPSSDPGRW